MDTNTNTIENETVTTQTYVRGVRLLGRVLKGIRALFVAVINLGVSQRF